jgi:tripartite-type tricarboxylate transporter receptor subunit TctC
MKRWAVLMMCGLLTVLGFGRAEAADYYAGKTITVIVGYPPAGGYSSYATPIAKYLGKHIPGNPTVIVQHMPGAASIVAANHIFNVAKPDGLTLGSINMFNLYATAMAKGSDVRYDLKTMDYIGNARSGNSVLMARGDIYTSLDQMKAAKDPIVLGISQKGDGHHLFGLSMEEAIKHPFKFIAGYGGGGEIDLALERKEIEVRVGNLNSYLISKPDWIKSGFVRLLAQSGAPDKSGKIVRDPRIADVPTVHELAPGNKLIEQIESFASIGDLLALVYVAPPKTSPEHLKILREGFMATLADPDFLQEAKGFNLEITPMDAAQVEQVVRRALDISPEVLDMIKKIKE